MSQGDNWLEHAVRVCTEIAIKCIDPNPEKRPEIHHIIETLVKTESTYGFIEVKYLIYNSESTEVGYYHFYILKSLRRMSPLSH